MVRPPAGQLTRSLAQLRQDLDAVLRAAVAGVHAGTLVIDALGRPAVQEALGRAAAVDVVAAGKAAAVMAQAFLRTSPVTPRACIGIGPAAPAAATGGLEWYDAGHPLPTDGSVRGARRALDVAARGGAGDLLVVLLSGGGSALMSLPAPGITLAEKQETVQRLLLHGADIHELNTVRKHLSSIKGGQLAAAAGGAVLTLAVSDVVGDDLSVIASGPTVPDASTFAAALDVLARHGGLTTYPAAVTARLHRGRDGQVPETPSAGDVRLSRSTAVVIGPQRGALDGAARAAAALGYPVHVVAEPVTGEARVAGPALVARAHALVPPARRPACVLAAGETTVTVVGAGKGGRNQECAFAMAQALATVDPPAAAASLGTDGIDGPTDAAGAAVDSDTFERARSRGIEHADVYLANNDTYVFFDRLGDLIRTGPTNTNVGDLQVLLFG